LTWLWLTGLLLRRPTRLLGAAVGVAITVAMLASLGTFLAQSQATMTRRAVRAVAVDWQVEVIQGGNPADAVSAVGATAGVTASAPVQFAQSTGLSSITGDSTQTTGPGVVLGLPDGYAATFPGQIRSLAGDLAGVLLAQQTAANLHAAPGDSVSIGRIGLPPATVTVSGIIDLPQANSLFQRIGAPSSAQPAAPPDNVVLLPARQWHALFDPLATIRPDLVTSQIHLRLDHGLPRDPAAAYTKVTAAARNLEARSVGSARVGDNLGATLDAARHDAAYAQVLFVFLGVPGALLAVALTATVAAAGRERRRAEQALLRVRGASAGQVLALAAVEAGFIGALGAGLGVTVAALIGRYAYGSAGFGNSTAAAVGWPLGAASLGMLIAAAVVLLPAQRDLRQHTVASDRVPIGTTAHPRWARYGLDAVLLTAAGVVFWSTGGAGYQLVVAPEGVPAISVSYWAFAGPALLWFGSALATWRIGDLILGPGRPVVATMLRPVAGQLAATVAAVLSRQRRPLVRAITLLSLAVAFAASTATFNATYRKQAEVDAQLTNGADVTVVPSPGAAPILNATAQLAGVPGVVAVESIQHRFAYIGSDLQDLYGVNPTTILRATALQDSYFPGAKSTDLMRTLATRPDSILVSAETVADFQLQTGDSVTLRLVDATTRQPKAVVFHYAGVVTEFPTAPKDSFLVTNADYVAAQTGSNAVGAYLVDTGGGDTAAAAARIRDLLGTSATITDIADVRVAVGSSLTAVDLGGLTRIELSFAVLLAVSAAGLVPALGFAERRRSHAILTALGARPRQLHAFIFSETAALGVVGLLTGAVTGTVLGVMLVRVLSGVFDPPPEAVTVPMTYLMTLAGATLIALLGVGAVGVLLARRPTMAALREL
jgi:putative ABC transport system permease protein